MPAPLGWVAPGRGVRVGPEPPYEEGALGKEVLREGCVSDFGKGCSAAARRSGCWADPLNRRRLCALGAGRLLTVASPCAGWHAVPLGECAREMRRILESSRQRDLGDRLVAQTVILQVLGAPSYAKVQ